MNSSLVNVLVSTGQILPSQLISDKTVSSYTYYATVSELEWLGVASTLNGKTVLTDNPISGVFKRLFFEGFEIELLSRKNVELLLAILEPKTIMEIAEELGVSIAQANIRVGKLAQFLSKEGHKYAISKSNHLLFEFISLVKKKDMRDFLWSRGQERLLKLPLDFNFEGSLTAFSRFSEFGLQVNPSHNFVYIPTKELSLEEVLSHALKFSENANDVALCILFYLKNKSKFNVIGIEKNCEKLGILQSWFDIVSYMEDQPVKQQKLFLPRSEFLEKAAIYHITMKQRFGQELINSIFLEVEEKLPEKIKLFFIGGNALMEHKAKNSTKDVDVVLLSEKEAFWFVNALKRTGYSEIKGRELQYGQLEASAMLEKDGFPRIDLFVKIICNALEFSEGMKKRSKKIKDGKLEIYLASLEDVFLLKSISSRDSDLVDCESIISKVPLKWKLIYKELISQNKNLTGMKELTILDHLEVLEKRLSIKIPITKKVLDFCIERGILYLAGKPVSVGEIRQKIDFSEIAIRNKINALVKNKKLKKIGGKPFKVVVIANSG